MISFEGVYIEFPLPLGSPTICHIHALSNATQPLDYIPEPAAGASTLEVMADVHQRFDDIDSGEVEVLDSTQEANQVTQF